MHAKVLEAYRKAKFDFQPVTQDLVEQDFRRKTQGSRIRRRINQIYRVRYANKDYIIYEVTEFARDLAGNEFTFTHSEGKIDMPIFNKQYEQETGAVVATAISRTEPVYLIPFTKNRMEKILNSGQIPFETKFTLDAGFAKYGGFTAQEFMTRHYDDLYEKATTGKLPERAKPLPPESDIESAHKSQMKQRGLLDTDRIAATRREIEGDDEIPEEVVKAYETEQTPSFSEPIAEEDEEDDRVIHSGRDAVEKSEKAERVTGHRTATTTKSKGRGRR